MQTKTITIIAALAAISASAADTLRVSSFIWSDSYKTTSPHLVDSVNCKGEVFEPDTNVTVVKRFFVETRTFTTAEISVPGWKDFTVMLDGAKVNKGEKLKFEPATHEIEITLSVPDSCCRDSLAVELICPDSGKLSQRTDGKRIFSLDYNTQGLSCCGCGISANGKFVSAGELFTNADGEKETEWKVFRPNGKQIAVLKDVPEWMPGSDRYWIRKASMRGNDLYAVDPESGVQSLLCRSIPDGYFTISPDEDFAIFSLSEEGPAEGSVHEVLSPEDRQPGWRDRGYLSLFDFKTGHTQRLTYGWHNSWLMDISKDGKKILFGTDRTDLTGRPTRLISVHTMDLTTMEVKTVIKDDGFLIDAAFSPDADKIAVSASTEAFGGVGKHVYEWQVPNAYDIHLYIVDIAARLGSSDPAAGVSPIGADFAPSVEGFEWSFADGNIYFFAQEKDMVHIFRYEPSKDRFTKLHSPEDNIRDFSLAAKAPAMVMCGQSLLNADRVWDLNLRNLEPELIDDISARRLENVSLGNGGSYEFTSSRGDRINCFYTLPPEFDPSRKYPMIVHYYGGCSPSSRYLVGSYSPELYSAQDYIFLVVNPSGAAGFGQKFAARHVNTAGAGVAEDIIEATRSFCASHDYVDSTRLGCFSASYGGFMTQLLLTMTDMFAVGISHAGISDHTSYWGEGWWGYSYSQVCMGNNFPWTNKYLYVERSPLYNADKIHTPLLFLHGSADTNVPIGESIQMFTALKMLGAETAFVVVDGENHGIREYGKRRAWLRTISAWFAKYLKGDDSWWNELYPEKNL